MSSSKKPASETPHMIRAANQGQVDTQTQREAQRPHNDPQSDQSEGAKAEGQPTAMHGKGAGFSRNMH